MPKTDFFDDDLVKRHESTQRIKVDAGEAPVATFGDPTSPGTRAEGGGVSDFNLTGMAKRRDELGSQVAQAMEELELLRSRQEDLEHEKHGLEELRRREREYDTGKREVLSHLTQSLVTLEKDEIQTEKLCELLGATRSQFRELLGEAEGLKEDEWPEDQLREELDKALTVIERVRVEYNKAISRIEAASPNIRSASGEHAPVALEEQRAQTLNARSFGEWFRIGFAFSLPLIVTLVAVGLVWVMFQLGWV